MRRDGRGNTKKLCGFIFFVVPLKKNFLGRTDANQQKQTKKIKVEI